MSPSRSGTRSTCQPCPGADHPPGAERLGELECGAAASPGAAPRAAARGSPATTTSTSSVDAPEQPVADRAADDPAALAGERGARERPAPRSRGAPARWSRSLAGHAGVMPHVTS